tara:strand:+ start:465 stop:1052 length:588 start_codon:yes stop_codon:yes gene_type:complete
MSTLKVDTILKRTGTGTITVGQSGDTISIPSGATLNSAGTNTLEGISNTPYFQATLSSEQTLSDNVLAKAAFNSELLDSAGAYDTSTYRFTVPSGQAGRYYISTSVIFQTSGSYGVIFPRLEIHKNGANQMYGYGPYNEQGNDQVGVFAAMLMDLSASDYIEIYVRNNNDQGTPSIKASTGSPDNACIFQGFKLI